METACDICGCTESNLVDGFYYCAECGTQDTNVRETLVEVVALADGAIALGSRRRITQIPKANEEQMTDDWYKWHGLNFLLRGLANDLVELGAAPSFKTKLLWLWTRYMKEYQNKADFGLTSDQQEEKPQEEQNLHENDGENIEDENFINDEDIFGIEENDLREHKKELYKVNIKRINMPLVLTFLYVALNLDKSHIQLTHLIRFVREGRLDVLHWQKHVPKELNPKKLFYCLLFSKQWIKYSYSTILQLAFQLFKELDLGNPIVPDVRMLVDEYMKELCLPNDMKPLVFSLMHFRSFDYLDMNVKFYDSGRIPSYELFVISHILWAMKICFGIDGAYENELSDSVDKINKIEGHPKSYNSEPTKRLFSFREWCKYVQFRKSMLWAHSLYLGAPNYCDMDDFVAFEHLGERPDYKKTYKDEIARNIISKLPDVEINVIPKSEFPATTTAHTCYTRVIIDHVQDPHIKQLLSEDFSQYSLKYITEDMFLVDPDSIDPKNIISGGKASHLIELGKDFSALKGFATTKFDQKVVYVKDCDNHNWVTTERPKLEHVNETVNVNDEPAIQETGVCSEEPHSLSVTNASSQVEIIETELKEDVNPTEYKDNTILIEDSKVFNESKIEIEIDKSHIEFEVNEQKLKEENLKISEEDEDVNIFDDNFAYLDAKKEDEFVDTEPPNKTLEPEHGLPNDNEVSPIPDLSTHNFLTQEYRDNERDSDASSIDSLHVTAETLDRAAVIKELVVHACQKYKISLNGQYINQPRKKNYVRKKTTENVERVKVRGSTKKKIQGLIDEYYNQVQQDIFLQMSNMVQSAITDFNASREDEPMDIDVPIIDNNNTSGIGDQNENEPNMETLNDSAKLKSVLDEVDNEIPYKIFDEESDGETQAEELLPKRNPDFDEATHNTSQLYIKTTEETTAPEIKLHPQLFNIIDEKLNENAHSNSIPIPKTEVNSDSEEDVSLSMLQELKLLREQLTRQQKRTKERKLPQLIKSSVPPYNYWLKHYSKGQHLSGLQRTVTEIDNSFPASFKLVLFECADVVGYPVHWVYNSLQRIERCIKHKYVRKRRLVPSYFEKEQKRFMQSKDLL